MVNKEVLGASKPKGLQAKAIHWSVHFLCHSSKLIDFSPSVMAILTLFKILCASFQVPE